jgi:hypothetical protein
MSLNFYTGLPGKVEHTFFYSTPLQGTCLDKEYDNNGHDKRNGNGSIYYGNPVFLRPACF